ISESRVDTPEGLPPPAGDIEQLVTTRIGRFLSEPARVFEALAPYVETAAQQRQMLHRAAELAANWPALKPRQLRPILAALIQRIVVHIDRVDIQLLPSRVAALLRDTLRGPTSADTADVEEQPLVLPVPAQLRRVGFGIRMLIDQAAVPGHAAKADPLAFRTVPEIPCNTRATRVPEPFRRYQCPCEPQMASFVSKAVLDNH